MDIGVKFPLYATGVPDSIPLSISSTTGIMRHLFFFLFFLLHSVCHTARGASSIADPDTHDGPDTLTEAEFVPYELLSDEEDPEEHERIGLNYILEFCILTFAPIRRAPSSLSYRHPGTACHDPFCSRKMTEPWSNMYRSPLTFQNDNATVKHYEEFVDFDTKRGRLDVMVEGIPNEIELLSSFYASDSNQLIDIKSEHRF